MALGAALSLSIACTVGCGSDASHGDELANASQSVTPTQTHESIALSTALTPLDHAKPGDDVLTQRANNSRTGATNRAGFNATTLQSSGFGRLATLHVVGKVRSQPLYIQNVVMAADAKAHDLVLVATAANNVYAFDANTFAQLWMTPLGPPSTDQADFGIQSTPVIDPVRRTIDLSFRTQNGSVVEQHVIMLPLSTGLKNPAHDHVITNGLMGATPPTQKGAHPDGSGWACSGYELCGDIRGVKQHASLLLANDIVYVAFSMADEGFWQWSTYPERKARGQLLAFDAATMNFMGSWTAVSGSATRMGGGIWQASVAPAADDAGDVYLATGNAMSWVAAPDKTKGYVQPDQSPVDNPYPRDYAPEAGSHANAVVHLHPTVSQTGNAKRVQIGPVTSFTPHRSYWHNVEDIDLGSSGPMLVPGTNQLVHAGKEGVLYVLDRNSMGDFADKAYLTQADYFGWPQSMSGLPDPITTCPLNGTWFQGANAPRYIPPLAAGSDVGPLQILQVGENFDIHNPLSGCWSDLPHIHGTPAFGHFSDGRAWVYVWPEKDFLKAFPMSFPAQSSQSISVGATPAKSESTAPIPNGMPGGMLSLSVDPSNASGLLFASSPLGFDSDTTASRGSLRAFNAIPTADGKLTQVWADSDSYRFAKFVPPTIARDYVFQATFSDEVLVYGPGANPAQTRYAPIGAAIGMASQDANQAQTVAGFIADDGALHVLWKGDGLDWDPSRNAQVTQPGLAKAGAAITLVSSGNTIDAVFVKANGAIHFTSREVPSAWNDHGEIPGPKSFGDGTRLGALVQDGALQVLVAEPDGRMHVLDGRNGFADTAIADGRRYNPKAGIATTTNGGNELDAFAVDTQGEIVRFKSTRLGSGWSAWSSTVLGSGFTPDANLATAFYGSLGVFGVDRGGVVTGLVSADGGATFSRTAFTVGSYAPPGANVAVAATADPSLNPSPKRVFLYLVGNAGALDGFDLMSLPSSPVSVPKGGYGFTAAMNAHSDTFGIASPGSPLAAWGSEVIISGTNGFSTVTYKQAINHPTDWSDPALLPLAPPAPMLGILPELETIPAAGAYLPLEKWVSADFDRDGLADMANIWSTVEGGAVGIDVYRNLGNGSFQPQAQWGKVGSTGAFMSTEKWIVGDYNCDGWPDLANVWSTVEGGAIGIDVYLNVHNGFEFHPQWGKIGSTGGFFASSKWVSGDFNGDSCNDDLADVWCTVEGGSIGIDVYLSDKRSAFAFKPQWGAVGTQGAFYGSEKWFAGDFDGDHKTDIADVWDDVVNGVPQIAIDVHLNAGNSFVGSPQWGVPGQQGIFDPNDKWVVGDFDGNGLPDLAEAFSDDNSGFVSIDMHLNHGKGGGFTVQRWATLVGPYNGGASVYNATRIPSVGFDIAQTWFAGSFKSKTSLDFGYVYDAGGVTGIGEFYRWNPVRIPRLPL